MNFENIDVKDIGCFGFTSPKSKCWLAMLNKAKEYANVADKKMLEKSFSRNVETSYYRLCGISFVDLDTDLNYFASYVNSWKKWELEIEDGKAEVSIEDKKKFFATDEMKKIAARAAKYIEDAVAAYNESLKQQLEGGKMLDVDETKLEAVIKCATDARTMDAFKKLTVSEKSFS